MISDEWPPYFGGAGLCMALFARELSARGHQLMSVSAWNDDAPSHELEGDVAVHRIRELPSRALWMSENSSRHSPAPFPDLEATWRIRKLIHKFEPDVIPAYGWLAHSAAAALIGKKIPLILWGHDYANVCAMRTLYRLEREICSGPSPKKCLTCSVQGRGTARGALATAGVFGIGPLLRRKTTAIHGVSRFVASTMSKDLGEEIPSVVIENFHEDEPETQPELDASILEQLPEDPYILFVGSLSRVKGVSELAEAYGQLHDPPPLVMAGPQTPDSPPIPEGIHLVNDVPHPTIMAMWERALFGVFPSKWPEPLATVVHEAMSKGRPAIGTTPGGHEDMIDDGETGLIVPAGDVGALAKALSTLVDDAEMRERMGALALERAKRFTRKVAVPRLESFYYDTAMKNRAPS